MPSSPYQALVVEDDAAEQQCVGLALGREGFFCDFAADGIEAQKLVASKRYDVVVTDLKMPNRHGHALTVDLLNLDDRPVIVVHTGVNEPRLVKDLLARGVDDIVLKPIPHLVLAAKVKTLVDRKAAQTPKAELPDFAADAKSVSPALPQNEQTISWPAMQQRLASVSSLLPISQVALEVYKLARSEECDAADVAAAIEKEGSLAAEMLRLGNCAYHNPTAKPTSDLRQIVRRIGHRRTGETALATHALARFTSSALPWMDVALTWQRSIAARVAIELLIEEGGYQYLDDGLVLCANMHALGRIVLATLYPLHYERMLAACQASHSTLRREEQLVFPKDHAKVMADVLTRWNVPADVHYALRYALDSYDTITSLSGTARIRAVLLKLAIVIGRIVVGIWKPWDTVEIPPAGTFERLRIKNIPQLIAHARARFCTLLQELGTPLPRKSADTKGVDRRLCYATLCDDQSDVLPMLIEAMGFTLEPCAAASVGKNVDPVVINGIGAASPLLKTTLAVAAQHHVIICGATQSKELKAFGRVLELPTSYGQFHSACCAAARS